MGSVKLSDVRPEWNNSIPNPAIRVIAAGGLEEGSKVELVDFILYERTFYARIVQQTFQNIKRMFPTYVA